MRYSWPGNVRELKNLIERLVIMVPTRVITASQLPPPTMTNCPETPETSEAILAADTFREAREEFEKEFLLRKLEENDWNVSRTAEAIEMERSNLHRKIRSYGIEVKK
jgi:two-component system nitrogen regulation response regulator NtrX